MAAERTGAKQPGLPEHRGKYSGVVSFWLKERMGSATMRVEATPLSEIKGWGFINADGAFVQTIRETNAFANVDTEGRARFFTFNGRRVFASGREVHDYEQPGTIQVKDPSDPEGHCGTVGLLVDRKTGDVLVQITAEPFQAEPGAEPGAYLSIRPSIQGSYDNLRLHKVKFSETVDPSQYNHSVTVDASRMQGKVRYGITFVDRESIDISQSPNYRWFSRKEIGAALREENLPFNGFFHAVYNLARETRKPTETMWRRTHSQAQ